MKKVRITNGTDLERAYANVQLTPGSSVEKTLDDNVVDFLQGTPFKVKILEENVAPVGDAEETTDADGDRVSNMADAQAFDLAQRVNGDVNEVDDGGDGVISGEDVERYYRLTDDTEDDDTGNTEDREEETPDGATE